MEDVIKDRKLQISHRHIFLAKLKFWQIFVVILSISHGPDPDKYQEFFSAHQFFHARATNTLNIFNIIGKCVNFRLRLLTEYWTNQCETDLRAAPRGFLLMTWENLRPYKWKKPKGVALLYSLDLN